MSVLDTIVKRKKEEVLFLKKQNPDFSTISKRNKGFFWNNLFKDRVNVIAEIKKASPSAGVLKQEFSPAQIAPLYQKNGANAISVLTDKDFFQGCLEYLDEVRNTVQIPILRKDFIIDPIQIEEACAHKADAFLIIAAILSVNEMKEFIKIGDSLGLDYILEIHNEEDLEKALKTDAPVIGINNRDLKTFQLDLTTTLTLSKKLPQDRKIITESGIESLDDVRMFLNNQISTFLIGSLFMKSKNPGDALAKVKKL